MSKLVTPTELAGIVNALLTNPSALGELESSDQYQSFYRAVGEAVASHCGGELSPAVYEGSKDNEYVQAADSPLIGVLPNNSLPSLNRNVWAHVDTEGWDEEAVEGLETGEPVSDDDLSGINDAIASSLAVTACSLPSTGTPVINTDKAWLITGRLHGDDDDMALLVEADSLDVAEDRFVSYVKDMNDVLYDPANPRRSNREQDNVYIIYSESLSGAYETRLKKVVSSEPEPEPEPASQMQM